LKGGARFLQLLGSGSDEEIISFNIISLLLKNGINSSTLHLNFNFSNAKKQKQIYQNIDLI